MWCKKVLLRASVALLAIVSVHAQRSSPQFSFTQLSPQVNQFGSDIFSSNGQLNNLNLPSVGNAGAAQSSFVQVNTGPQQAPASLLDPSYPGTNQLVAQSQPSPQASFLQPQPAQQQQQAQLSQPRQEQASIQPTRSSLSLTSLNFPQQSQQSQSSLRQSLAQQLGFQAPQTTAPPALPELPTHQSGRRHQQSPQISSSISTSTSSSVSATSSLSVPRNAAASHHHPSTSTSISTSSSSSSSSSSSGSQTAAANQRAQQRNSQHLNSNHNTQVHSVESARRAEASSASQAASSGQSYSCPDSFGFFRHHKSCDKYWACVNGTATLKVCGNGLNFDDSDPKRENCAYPFSVDCGSDRTDLEPPISTPNCPRLYGLFSDTANCRVFYSCWNGEASKYECPPGLAYDAEQRVCVWADLVDRCDQSEVSDGFVCPDASEVDQPGHYTRHAHPTDCRKFYVCIDGTARPYGCSFGTVFNVDSLQCDEPESVSGCEKYYGDLDPKLAKKLARESQSGNVGQSGNTARATSSSANQ